MKINSAIKKLKKYGYIISIPSFIILTGYYIDSSLDIQKEKNEILIQEIDFLKEKNSSTSYSQAFSELNSQKALYENKIKDINENILIIKLKLSETKGNLLKKEKLVNELRESLFKKEILLSKIYLLIGKLAIEYREKLGKSTYALKNNGNDKPKLKREGGIKEIIVKDILNDDLFSEVKKLSKEINTLTHVNRLLSDRINYFEQIEKELLMLNNESIIGDFKVLISLNKQIYKLGETIKLKVLSGTDSFFIVYYYNRSSGVEKISKVETNQMTSTLIASQPFGHYEEIIVVSGDNLKQLHDFDEEAMASILKNYLFSHSRNLDMVGVIERLKLNITSYKFIIK